MTNILPTYPRSNLEFTHGKGCYLYSLDGNEYLDFGSGIAVNSLGYSHEYLNSKLLEQSKKLWHVSNIYQIPQQEKLAKRLCEISFADYAFFCNSGTEAVEASIKIARRYFYKKNNSKTKNEIITFEGSFHGRTYAALSAQQNKKYSEGFGKMLPGFINIPFNDIEALKNTVNESTAAVLIETIQGEGGIRPTPLNFLKEIREICNKSNSLMFLDEVQSGFGRTGKLFAYQWADLNPDIIAVAKGIGSGFPMGACLTSNDACIAMIKGSHGSTFGGNPLAVAVGKAVINEILSKNFLDNVDKISRYLWNKLKALEKKYDEIIEVRGAGLLLGIKTKNSNIDISKKFEEKGLLTIPASDNIIRLAPPLIITFDHVDEAIKKIEDALV